MRIIDADRYQKDLLSTYDDCSIELEVLDRQPLVSAIPISERMTNGDMIKAMFPEIEMWGESKDTLDYSLGGMIHRVMKSWWNSPYKGKIN